MTITDILDKFPHKEFELNPNKSIHTSIKDINKKLSANASAIYSTLSDGRHSLLGLTLPATVYNTISNISFVRPLNTGPRLIIFTSVNTHAMLAAQEYYAEVLNIFKEIEDVD